MKKSLHLTHGRNNLWLLGMILVSTIWPVRGWAIKNVWIDVPMNTRDGMQTMGVVVDTTLQFTAVTAWVPTNLTWTWSTGTTPTGSAWPYGYAQRSFPNAGTFDITATYAGEVSYAQRVIAVDASVTVTDRIPIYGAPLNIQGSATITLTTSPLPAGMEGIPVTISRNCGGSGSAIFAGGSTTEIINRTQTLAIRGLANSDAAHNMTIQAANGVEYFSVRTWPVNFRELTNRRSAIGGVLHFEYTWDSESGNNLNLTGITMGEYVSYNHNWNTPPYAVPQDNPIIVNISAAWYGMNDDQKYIEFSDPPYVEDRNFVGTQYYRFSDSVLNPNNFINVAGPLTITREISPLFNIWYYTIWKQDYGTSITMP